MASALTGPLWHNIFTCGVPILGLHSVTTPKLESITVVYYKRQSPLTGVVSEVQNGVARVLAKHVTRAHVRAKVGDNGTRRCVLIVQTAALVLIRKACYDWSI
jgi:hypothetical protein